MRYKNRLFYDLTSKVEQFPPAHAAGSDGLLCLGGDLEPERLLLAYSKGIFPWYSEGTPILWWSLDPRLVLPLKEMHIPGSLRKVLKSKKFFCTINAAFDQVISGCAKAGRPKQDGTWILPEMIFAYKKMHKLGYALSAESWYEGRLAGGIYGIILGKAFFGESMFYNVPDASKAALAHLVGFLRKKGILLFDCQQTTANMLRFGAREIPRKKFMRLLSLALKPPRIIRRKNFKPPSKRPL